jgi:3-deoxy-D-manno-octulosonate 8-phosphate phosphatase (KDO 8-P phosphatase)
MGSARLQGFPVAGLEFAGESNRVSLIVGIVRHLCECNIDLCFGHAPDLLFDRLNNKFIEARSLRMDRNCLGFIVNVPGKPNRRVLILLPGCERHNGISRKRNHTTTYMIVAIISAITFAIQSDSIFAMPKLLSAIARARKIKLLLFDVDGVLTDGKLFFVPQNSQAPNGTTADRTAQGQVEVKGFHAHDGVAHSLARIAGLKTGLITRRSSETVALRARDLKLEYVRQGIRDKRAALEEIVKEEGIELEQAAFVGDDVIDLPAMRAGGFAIAVKNARAEVKQEAHYVTARAGGEGALRDAVEFILKAQGKWKKVVEEYIGERSPNGSYQLSAVSHQRKSKVH